ncbi:uncharacterized protein MYCFIDRAFT_210225 [Pseudocercospora fijiensis CIRAD86]|uniref:Glutamyl-tRNA synthetase n=1 Tax=Pseudocercospora fijiensis (strain CIRAD86) TaxID=383855 RepID=M3B7V9_PSEFD|nr:uncharacterized protein MYCFIDRAFT_210225 [Pseudocercospora fijiensis CIRAD86]EME85407.1 hypothetical protein MYCFIDRAFT_210225 [Pseudocercospora fijiensis CIRAD86]
MADKFEKARGLIYAAHNEDPNKHTKQDGSELPYETHYSQKMEGFLHKRAPSASEVLKLAICGQHFRRWEVRRDSFTEGKLGYHAWRTHLKKRQAQQVGDILEQCGYAEADVQRCRGLIEKEGLKQGEEEVQVLEDVACLVFLDDQFEEFKERHDEQKIIGILQKTWAKMSKEGQDMALHLAMTDECKALVGKALA